MTVSRLSRSAGQFSAARLALYPERLAGDRRPITAEVHLTNVCNLACTYCRHSRPFNDTPAPMTLDGFQGVLSRLIELGVEGVILTGGGEPMLAPSFEGIASHLEDTGIPYGVNTNLTLLRECSPSWLKVSLDAGDQSTYLRRRGRDVFDEVVANLSEFKRRHPSTTLGVQCVVEQPDDIEPFVVGCARLDVDYMALRPVESKSLYYEGAMLHAIQDRLAWAEDFDERVVINPKWRYLGACYDECLANWSVVSIDHNGDVLYCINRPDDRVCSIHSGQVLERLGAFAMDSRDCEVPCRMSEANAFMAAYEDGARGFV